MAHQQSRWYNNMRFVGQYFELGELYTIGNKKGKYKFIKVTQCGYNLVDIETHKCFLRSHLYVLPKLRDLYKDKIKWIYVYERLHIRKVE